MKQYTLKEISERTGISTSTLRDYLDTDEKKRFWGVHGNPPLYPESALALFDSLKELREQKIIKPQNFLELRHLITEHSGEIGKRDSRSGALVVPDSENAILDMTAERLADVIANAVRYAVSEALQADRLQHAPAPPDEILTAQEVADIVKCHPGNIRRSTGLLPVKRGRYRASDVYRYIQALEPQQPRVRRRPAPALPPAPEPPLPARNQPES